MSELFIGRMSIRVDNNDDRYDKKYYDAGFNKQKNPRQQDWLNGLKVDDFVLLSISFTEERDDKIVYSKTKNNKVVLWKVKSIEETKTNFEELKDEIAVKLHKLAALTILKITKVTTNLAMKSSNSSAFWKLDLSKPLNDEMLQNLKSDDFYSNEDNYRKMILLNNKNEIIETSNDIQLYKDGNKIKIYNSEFIDPSLIKQFRDQTIYLDAKGVERKPQKDNFLYKIKQGYLSDITIPQLYDSMFTEYNKKSDSNIEEETDNEEDDENKLESKKKMETVKYSVSTRER